MDSSLIQIDRNMISGLTLRNEVGGYTIRFQFPPKIVSESNSSSWEEKELWAIEPLKIHKGSTGRAISMKWEYIASEGKTWNAATIGDMCRNLKAYFFKFDDKKYPIVKLKYGKVVPIEINFRMMSLDISYSEELVDNYGIFPLRTEVSVKLELATKLNDDQGGEMKLDLQNLAPAVYRWY